MVVAENGLSPLLSYLIWPAIVMLPLVLTFNNNYQKVFPNNWFDESPQVYWENSVYRMPSPLGLSLGIIAVVIGQFWVLLFFVLKRQGVFGWPKSIQKEGARRYELGEGLATHLFQPGGFIMLGLYLIGYWMSGFMPASYYSFSGGINWLQVFAQLIIQEGLQYASHGIEHRFPDLYKVSHKPHHRFTNPRLFDAFDGSEADTFLMILVPLLITSRFVNANVWTYMAFGSLYANWLCLIHSEYSMPWDRLFRLLGFGTSGDHHVHHKLFVSNYGHLFMYYDYIFGTYRSPESVEMFNK
jgi:lathosterol oxidase